MRKELEEPEDMKRAFFASSIFMSSSIKSYMSFWSIHSVSLFFLVMTLILFKKGEKTKERERRRIAERNENIY
jgi:hypothetical protein